MTQKELLYIEDAVSHETNIINIMEELLKKVEDNEIINYMDKELNKHNKMKKRLLDLLEDKSNE